MVDLMQSMTFESSLGDCFRRGENEPVNKKTLLSILENEGADGKPVILIVAGVRPGNIPGRYNLREVRKILTYESKQFLEDEKARQEAEEVAREAASRAARLEAIKARLRAERKLDAGDFDSRYEEQDREAAKVAEAEIEAEAAAILEAEELKE